MDEYTKKVSNFARRVGLAAVVGSACSLIHCSKRVEAEYTPVRTANIIFLQKYGENRYEINKDFLHYAFHSPVCSGEWEGTALSKTILTFPANCPEIIPLEGIVTSHFPGCRRTTYYIKRDIINGKAENQRADIVVKTILSGEIKNSYVPVNCVRED